MTSGRHESRLDPLTAEWVTIVGHRQDRPHLPADRCPFCVGGLEAPAPYRVRAFPNRWPAYLPGPAPRLAPGDRTRPPRGAAEVILYSPDHRASLGSLGAGGVRAVVDLWTERTAALLARSEVEYVLVFENRGRPVGATIDHPHGQVYAYDFVPPVPRRELEVAAAARRCPLCETLAREQQDRARLVVSRGTGHAWVPFAAGSPFELLVAPGPHRPGLPELSDGERGDLAWVLAEVLARYDALFDEPMPYMLWVHHGVHVHVHLVPALRAPGTLRYVAAAELGSGTLGNPVAPEVAAEALRGAVGIRSTAGPSGRGAGTRR